jgi:hypothetical protein
MSNKSVYLCRERGKRRLFSFLPKLSSSVLLLLLLLLLRSESMKFLLLLLLLETFWHCSVILLGSEGKKIFGNLI